MALKLPPRFANLPAGVLFDQDLPDAVFRTLAQLHGLAWQSKGERTPPATVIEFADLRGLKERRMYDHLRKLKTLGYIRVENLGHKQIIIFPLRWDLGTALPAKDDALPSDDVLTASTDERALPLRWEPDTALSPSVSAVNPNSNDYVTAINCSKKLHKADSTAKDCSKKPDPSDFTAKDCSKNHSRCRSSFKNTKSVLKQQQQRQTTITAINCSKIPPDYQPVVDWLVNRCGSPGEIARKAVCASIKRDNDPNFVKYDMLRWLAYCRSERGKSINAPGIFIARKIEHAEACPDYFQTDYSHPLHAEIRMLERLLE